MRLHREEAKNMRKERDIEPEKEMKAQKRRLKPKKGDQSQKKEMPSIMAKELDWKPSGSLLE